MKYLALICLAVLGCFEFIIRITLTTAFCLLTFLLGIILVYEDPDVFLDVKCFNMAAALAKNE